MQHSQLLCLAGHVAGHATECAAMLGVQPVHAQHTCTGVRTYHVDTVLARHDRYAVKRPKDVQRQITAGHAARDTGHLTDISRLVAKFEMSDLRGNCSSRKWY